MSAEQQNNFGQGFNKAEGFVSENKKSLLVIGGTIVSLVLLYFAYQQFVVAPREKEASSQMFMAERYFEMDSISKAINGDGNFMGFAEIADEYNGTKSGNLANYYLGMGYIRQGNYEQAIEALEDFSSEDKVLASLAYAGIGDAYMELNDFKKAASNYASALSKESNKFTSPIILMKLALAYESNNDFKKALEAYTKIKKEYTESPEARDIDKFIARVEVKL